MQYNQAISNRAVRPRELNIRIDEAGWALFLIMLGAIWLFPSIGIPSGAWLFGAGLILIGINLVRYFYGISMSGFTIFLGFVAMFAGAGAIYNLDFPFFPALFVILGASLLMRALFKE